MVAFEVEDMAAVKRLLDSLTVFTLAESLGGVETLISNPASMTTGKWLSGFSETPLRASRLSASMTSMLSSFSRSATRINSLV